MNLSYRARGGRGRQEGKEKREIERETEREGRVG